MAQLPLRPRQPGLRPPDWCPSQVGTYVRVREGFLFKRKHIGRIVGYDMGHSKYEIGVRYGGWGRGEWKFWSGGLWAFPHKVEAITEAEALRVEVDQ